MREVLGKGASPPHTANARKLPRPVTSRTTPSVCNVRSNAVAVCGAILSCAASAFGVSTIEDRP